MIRDTDERIDERCYKRDNETYAVQIHEDLQRTLAGLSVALRWIPSKARYPYTHFCWGTEFRHQEKRWSWIKMWK